MKNISKGNFGQEGRSPQFKFSSLNIGSIDYNTSNRDLEPDEDDEAIFDELDDFGNGYEEDEDEAFRTHAL